MPGMAVIVSIWKRLVDIPVNTLVVGPTNGLYNWTVLCPEMFACPVSVHMRDATAVKIFVWVLGKLIACLKTMPFTAKPCRLTGTRCSPAVSMLYSMDSRHSINYVVTMLCFSAPPCVAPRSDQSTVLCLVLGFVEERHFRGPF